MGTIHLPPDQQRAQAPDQQSRPEVVANADGQSLIGKESQGERNPEIGRVSGAAAKPQRGRRQLSQSRQARGTHKNKTHGKHRKACGLQHVAAEATLQQQAHHTDRHTEPHQRCGQASGQGFMASTSPEPNQKGGHKLQQKPKNGHLHQINRP